MALLKQWRDMAYSETANKGDLQRLWSAYFQKEKDIYAILLKNPDEEVKGTVKELAEKYNIDIMTMVGFLDGINDSLKTANPIEEMEEDTQVSLAFDKELLYKNMVAAGADWLYNLEEWNDIFDEETRKKLYREQKESTTRYTRMIPVRAEVVRNIRNAVARMPDRACELILRQEWQYM